MAANGLNGQVRNLARLLGSGLGGGRGALGGIRRSRWRTPSRSWWRPCWSRGSGRPAGRVTSAEKASGDPEEAAEVVRGRVGALVDEWRDGLDATSQRPSVRTLIIFTLITSAGEGIMGTLSRRSSGMSCTAGPGLRRDHRCPGHRWGPRRLPRGRRARQVVAGDHGRGRFGRVRAGRPRDLPLPAPVGHPWPAAVGMVLVGLPGAPVVAGSRPSYQRNTTDERRGRVFSLDLARQAGQRGRRLARRRASSAARPASCRSSPCRAPGTSSPGLLVLARPGRRGGTP